MLVDKRRASGAASLLLNGPQFGWYNPSYVYSVGLHGAGFDIVGNTPFAYPVVLFGHNRDISWGATAGNGDTVDTYQEHLKPGNPHEYLFRGHYRQMAPRTDTIAVAGSAPQHVTVYSTVHGLVVSSDPAHGVAYSQRRTWAGREVSVLFTWMKSTQASTYPQWLDAARQLPISINWYYADRRGNIGYTFCGRFPIRPANQNTRLPASGTGNMEWLGFQSAAGLAGQLEQLSCARISRRGFRPVGTRRQSHHSAAPAGGTPNDHRGPAVGDHALRGVRRPQRPLLPAVHRASGERSAGGQPGARGLSGSRVLGPDQHPRARRPLRESRHGHDGDLAESHARRDARQDAASGCLRRILRYQLSGP
jgi:hypothetical protein